MNAITTVKSINKKGQIVLNSGDYFLANKKGFSIYTKIELYGKEPIISCGDFKKLTTLGLVKEINLGYNYALGKQSKRFEVC